MDEKGKRIEVNASSLVDLKAELLRKQEEFRRQKLESASTYIRAQATAKKPSIWNKKNVGVLERAQNDIEQKSEETDALDRAKAALQAKAKIYDQMTKGDSVPDEDGSKVFLVDFEQKSLKILAEKRKADRERAQAEEVKREREDEEERRQLAEAVPDSENPEEEWVDYVDNFGRTRRCLKKDLAGLVKVNADKKTPNASIKDEMKLLNNSASRDLMSEDMRRELRRQEWEREAEEAASRPAGPTHYSDVRFDEIREHGVGFFEFSKDEETRQQQLESLKKLRQQTEEQRTKTERLKEKRKALLQARLAKVKQRKTIQDVVGFDLDPMSTLEVELDEIGPQPAAEPTKEPEPLVRDVSLRSGAQEREWDKGKKRVYDEDSWLTERRDERATEFAPPSIYAENNVQLPPFKKAPPKQLYPARDKTQHKISEKLPSLQMDSVQPTAGDMVESESVGAALHAIRTAFDGSGKQVDNSSLASGGNTWAEFTVPGMEKFLPPPPPPPPPACYGSSEWQNFVPVSHFGNACSAGYEPTSSDILAGTAVWSDYQPYAANTFYFSLPAVPTSTQSEQWNYGSYTENTDSSLPTQDSTLVADVPVPTDSSTPSLPPTVAVTDAGARAAPQPAHFSSGPSLPQPKMPKYERVFLHDLPPTLPEPPKIGSVTIQYPSQEEIIGPRRRKDVPEMSEKDAIRNWQRQFDQRRTAASTMAASRSKVSADVSTGGGEVLLKPKDIPFASPYIQTTTGADKSKGDIAAGEFDPSKPPPSLKDEVL